MSKQNELNTDERENESSQSNEQSTSGSSTGGQLNVGTGEVEDGKQAQSLSESVISEQAEKDASTEKGTPSKERASVHAEFEKFKAENVYVAGEQQIEYKQYLLSNDQSISLKVFSAKQAVQISFEEEEDLKELYVYDEENINHLIEILDQKRLLILTGEPDTGKGTTALYLGYILANELEAISRETYLVPPLARNVKIDINEIIDNARDFNDRLIVFKDAFSQNNPDILEFFARLDRHVLSALRERLSKKQMFLIFTSDSLSLTNHQGHLPQLNVHGQLKPLKAELLEKGLSLKLEHLARSKGRLLEEIETTLVAQQRSLLIQTRPTMPQIVQFIDDYLIDVLEHGLDFEEALRRANDLTYWLQTDLADNFEAWCFILTLGLLQGLPESAGVSWFEFERLRTVISTHLRRELGLPSPPELYSKETVFDDFFLKRCRADIQRDTDTGEDVIRFISDRYPEMLWESFLSNNRRILATLLPQLKLLAEGDDLHMRIRAAQIIGRIGEMAPRQIAFSTIGRWSASSDLSQQATVGYLYQGILGSRNKHYRDDCLNFLKRLAESPDNANAWTAIATYKQIGVYDLSLAILELGNIMERRFSEKMEDAQRLLKIIERIENIFRDRSPNEMEKINLTVYAEILREIVQRIFAQDGGILFAIQYTIVSLCLTVDPVQVFEELTGWMSTGKRSAAALIALLFLQEGGIARELEEKSVEVPERDSDNSLSLQCNSIIGSMLSSENSVRKMAQFLTVIYDSFSTFFPIKSRRYFRKSFFLHLKSWAESAKPIEKCRDTMKQLFIELLQSPNSELYKQIYNTLNNDPIFSSRNAPLYEFACDVLRASLDIPAKES